MPDMISTSMPVDLDSGVKVDVVKKENRIPSNIKIYDKKGQVLGKDDFLKLFVTQLSKQDPLNPVNDKEFIAQMAQFSALEQMNNVSSNIRELKSIQANTFTGKLISGKDALTGNIISGEVTRIIYDNSGNIFLKTKDNTVEIKDVTSVEEVKKEIVSRETTPKLPDQVKPNTVVIGKSIIGNKAISEYIKNTDHGQIREK